MAGRSLHSGLDQVKEEKVSRKLQSESVELVSDHYLVAVLFKSVLINIELSCCSFVWGKT